MEPINYSQLIWITVIMEMMPFRGIQTALITVVLAKCNQLQKVSDFTAYCSYRSYTVNK